MRLCQKRSRSSGRLRHPTMPDSSLVRRLVRCEDRFFSAALRVHEFHVFRDVGPKSL